MFKAANQDSFNRIKDYKFNRGLVLNVPLRCTGGTKFGRGVLAVVTFGITEGKKVFYHHTFVAEGVNKYNANDKVYFVAQFFENETIPKRHPTEYTMNSNDLQVLIIFFKS